MRERNFLYISLAISVIGIIFLYFLSTTAKLEKTDVGKITPDDLNKNVRVCGAIKSLVTSKEKHVFFDIVDDTGKIDVVIFNNTAGKIDANDLRNNQRVCITGKVDIFRERLEIIVGNIEKVG